MSKNPRENPPEDEIGQIHQLGSDTIFDSQSMIFSTRKITRELTHIFCHKKCWSSEEIKSFFFLIVG